MLDRITREDDQLVLNTESLEDADINDFLIQHGCEHPHLLVRIDNHIFLNKSEAWAQRYIPFFVDAESLWHELRVKLVKPEHYYLIGVNPQETKALDFRLDLYFSLRNMLALICHHEGDETQPMKYVFFSSKESFLTKLEVLYALSYSELMSISVDELGTKHANSLKLAVAQEEDVHCDERRHVMRESLIEFFKNEESQKINLLMSKVSKFYLDYNERYRVYVSKFSVNKILAGIELERLGFLSKVQDAIMAQQTKAFAIPGGIVAVGVILRSATTGLDFFLIFVGLLISTWMISTLNSNVINHIDLLNEEFEQSASKYEEVVLGINEVNEKISLSRKKLSDISSAAKNKLSALTRISWLILVLVSLVLYDRVNLV